MYEQADRDCGRGRRRGASARRARGAARSRRSAVDEIHERILDAIHERRLLPGTQLVEEKLASIFGVSRTQIRQAITRLAHDGIVTVYPNRGAFVSQPDGRGGARGVRGAPR